jgi:hypothetical protein
LAIPPAGSAKGIDVRGDGGYVVGAGSVHSSGAVYRYVEGRGLGEIEVASAPEWLIDLISAPKAIDAADAEPNVPPVPADKLDRARGLRGAVWPASASTRPSRPRCCAP